MAISIDKVTHGGGTGANPNISITLGSTTTDRLLLCALTNNEHSGSVYATGLKVSGGSAMTEVTGARATQIVSSDRHKVQLFWIEETTSTGSTTFNVTISTSDDVNLIVYEITGADNSSPIGAVQTNTGTGADQTFSLTTTAADSYIVCCCDGENNPASPATGITEDIDVNYESDEVVFTGHRSAATATSYTVGCNVSGSFGNGGASWAVEVLAADSADALTAQDLTSGTPTIEASTIGQTHVLTASDLVSGTPELEAATLTQVVALTAQDLTSGTPELEAATIGQTHALSVAALTAGTPEIEASTIGQTHALTAADLVSGTPEIEAATLTETIIYPLTAQDIVSGTPELEAASIGQEHALTSQDITAGTVEIEAATLADSGFDPLIAVDLVLSAPEIEAATLGQVHVLSVPDLVIGAPTLESPVLGALTNYNQALRQFSVRDATSLVNHYNEDWHALFDLEGIPTGTLDERMLQWINIRLSSNYTSLQSAKTAFAQAEGYNYYDEIALFSA